jgi:flavin reductase (DIM6/NTAB) family NADH-FMN oxidoreductase RutF
MRKDLGKELIFLPLPVLMIGTYNENDNANIMSAAWGGIYDYGEIIIALSKHKTTDNLEIKKAFTVSFATKETVTISDYFGIVSGNEEDKISKSGVHVTKSKFVDAPIIEEYPLTLECKVKSFEEGTLIGKVVNVNCDEKYIDENGKVDSSKINFVTYDMTSNSYRVIGDIVGKAFKEGLSIK